MPGLDYTPQQMFWISAGLVWCSVYREEGDSSLMQLKFSNIQNEFFFLSNEKPCNSWRSLAGTI